MDRRIAALGILLLLTPALPQQAWAQDTPDPDQRHRPLIIVGDQALATCPCVDEGSGTAQDPYVIRDMHISNPVLGVMIAQVQAHVVLENITYEALDDLDQWNMLVEELIATFGSAGALVPSPSFSRGFHLLGAQNVRIVGSRAVDAEQGALLEDVDDVSVELTTTTVPWTGATSDTQVESGVVVDGGTDVHISGSATVSHVVEESFWRSNAPGPEVERERTTLRVIDAEAEIGPWTATGWIGLHAIDATVTAHDLTLVDDLMAVATLTEDADVTITDSRIDTRIGNLVFQDGDGRYEITQSDVTASRSQGRHVHLDDVTFQGAEGCLFLIEGSIQASTIQGCTFQDAFPGPNPGQDLLVAGSTLTDTILDVSLGSRLTIQDSTLTGQTTEIVATRGAKLTVVNTTLADAPGALRILIDDNVPQVTLTDVAFEHAGLEIQPATDQAPLDLAATNVSFDGHPFHVAPAGSVGPGTYGAILIPPGPAPASVHQATVASGGIHAWGRPSTTVTSSSITGQGAIGIEAYHTSNLTVTDTSVDGPLRGIAPMIGVDELHVHRVTFQDSGIATGQPPAVLDIQETTVAGHPIQVIDAPTTLTGPVGQVFAQDAGTLTLENATLVPTSISVVSHNTSLVLDNVTAQGPSTAGILAWDADLVELTNVTLNASRAQGAFSHRDDGNAKHLRGHLGWARATDLWHDEVITVRGLEADGGLRFGSSGGDQTITDVLCRCPLLYVWGGGLTMTNVTAIDAKVVTRSHPDGVLLDRITVKGGWGMTLWGPDGHVVNDTLVQGTLNGVVFRSFLSGCRADLQNSDLVDNTIQVAAFGCTVTAANDWWGQPGGPDPARVSEQDGRVIIEDSRDQPNRS